MTISIPPWANGPFELLVHAEGHLRGGDDFDRRMALIGFDNAIEVGITTYLTLNPIQRGNRSYSSTDVDRWLSNYHTKLTFLEAEIAVRGRACRVDKSHIIWAHDHRNEQYHGGLKGTPEQSVLKIVRDAALWVFELLFDVTNPEDLLEQAILQRSPQKASIPDRAFDVAIDARYGLVEVGGQTYYVSEVLFAVDEAAYRDLGGRLCASPDNSDSEADQA